MRLVHDVLRRERGACGKRAYTLRDREHFELWTSDAAAAISRLSCLKASNGEVIGVSETYSSKAAMDTGIDSVKKNAPIAPIEQAQPNARRRRATWSEDRLRYLEAG